MLCVCIKKAAAFLRGDNFLIFIIIILHFFFLIFLFKINIIIIQNEFLIFSHEIIYSMLILDYLRLLTGDLNYKNILLSNSPSRKSNVCVTIVVLLPRTL